MEDELQREWERLEARARELIRDEKLFDGRRGLRMFQMVVEPSFEDAVCWNVFQSGIGPDAKHFGGRAVWRRGADMEKLHTPLTRLKHLGELSPTVEARVFELPGELVESSLGPLKSVSIPVFAEKVPMGLDGTGYELTLCESYFAVARFEWWQQGPAEWERLTETALSIFDKLEAFTSGRQSDEPTV